MPKQFGGLSRTLPFGQLADVGKPTIIKVGSRFHEEKHFDIGSNGKLTEVEPSLLNDAFEHTNLMDTHFNAIYVKYFHGQKSHFPGKQTFGFEQFVY